MTERPLKPEKVVAAFDSASVLHAATVAALEHKPFPRLGNPAPMGPIVRAASRVPWSILRGIYARIGGSEGIEPEQLGRVDLGPVAHSFADAYPDRPDQPYPAVMIGASNGALTHLAAAMQIPWLPQTVLVPVANVGDPQRPDLALEFGRRVAPALTERNPDVAVHQMHDSAQDELMVARMAYFRTKWMELPEAYVAFLTERLAPGAPVILIDDGSTWPVTRVAERHVFQAGGRGGLRPDDYFAMPHTPQPDSDAAEAEWGTHPHFAAAVERAARETGHPVVHLRLDGPQEAAHPVALALREWTRERGGLADRLLVTSFVLGDPWRTFQLGRVPFWSFFPVREAADALEAHLEVARYRSVDLTLFQHGADSPGHSTPHDLAELVRRHGAEPRFVGLRADADPHDLGALARFSDALGAELDAPDARPLPWAPLEVEAGIRALHQLTLPFAARSPR
ncbi:hypothetical protein [Schumannella soli]|uniref:Uncharacterized protein n=1 Tax=Schumannella soli TaxID=2590779 RepID=A0A506Y648_9MICO|nr:hypothetical protein [Schumannella soli]TPW77495.1 hypothetical protein FJ657_02090 [Schumannella soli]